MSIAAPATSRAVPAVQPTAAAAPAAGLARGEGRGADAAPAESSRRQRIVAATVDALGSDAVAAGPALNRFAAALMHDLAQLGGERGAGTRARGWDDLGSRLGQLAQAAAKAEKPSPLTATTAAIHVMQVPSSRLIEAFATLREALPSALDGSGSDARAQLAAFLGRLADDAPASMPLAGALLDTRA